MYVTVFSCLDLNTLQENMLKQISHVTWKLIHKHLKIQQY